MDICVYIYIHMDIYIYIYTYHVCVCIFQWVSWLTSFNYIKVVSAPGTWRACFPRYTDQVAAPRSFHGPFSRPWTSMLVYWLHRCYITTVSLYLPLFTCITGHNWAILKGKCWQIVHQRAAKGRVETRPSCNGIAMGGKPS